MKQGWGGRGGRGRIMEGFRREGGGRKGCNISRRRRGRGRRKKEGRGGGGGRG